MPGEFGNAKELTAVMVHVLHLAPGVRIRRPILMFGEN